MGEKLAGPPTVPDTAPKELRDFLACTADRYVFRDGPLTWLDVSPRPNLKIKPGKAPGTATLELKALGITISLPASVSNGKLSIDTSNQMFLPDSAADEIKRFVDGMNGWFGQNGKQLGPPVFGPDGMALTKIPASGQATQPAPAPVPVPVAPPPVEVPNPVAGSAPVGVHPSPHAHDGTAPPPYLDTPIPPPPLPRGEAFGPYSKAGPPQPLSDEGPGPGVVGAAGPGGPKAPSGMGRLARWWLIAAVIIAILGLGAFVALGRPGPSASPPSSATPTAGATVAPQASAAATPGAATPGAAATPNGAANGRFEILSDVAVDSCHHDYEIAFRVFDSSGIGAVYAGKPVTYQVLEGEVLNAVAGPDGSWTMAVSETFEETSAGCFSRLRPRVLTVDGQPAF